MDQAKLERDLQADLCLADHNQDEYRCPRSSYSIDMLVRDTSKEGQEMVWAVEYDGPSHFLNDNSLNGKTLLKREILCTCTRMLFRVWGLGLRI